jgi:hypothetical protein
MESVWIIVPSSVSIHDLRAVLPDLDDVSSISVGDPPTQMRIEKSAPLAQADRIDIEQASTISELEGDEAERRRIRAVVSDPVYYALRYHGTDVATRVLKAVAGSGLAEGPLLITDGEGWVGTGEEFLQRIEQDPEWWHWWRSNDA